jgi:hypothetical protein
VLSAERDRHHRKANRDERHALKHLFAFEFVDLHVDLDGRNRQRPRQKTLVSCHVSDVPLIARMPRRRGPRACFSLDNERGLFYRARATTRRERSLFSPPRSAWFIV